MKKYLFVVAAIPLVAAVLMFTPLVNGGLSTLASDGRWRVCNTNSNPALGGGCYLVNFLLPAFSAEEKAFKEKLDQLGPPPAKVSKDDIVKIMGREPDQANGVDSLNGQFAWSNIGPGSNAQRSVTVYLFNGHFNQLIWNQPNRFFLVRGYPAS